MSFITQTTLQSFVSDNSYLTKETNPAGLAEAILQADEIIRQKTGITIPTDPSTANAKLRNIACCLVLFYTTPMQGKLSEYELSFRKKLYDEAMSQLEAIQNGDDPLIDNAGAVVSAAKDTYFESTQRLDSPL